MFASTPRLVVDPAVYDIVLAEPDAASPPGTLGVFDYAGERTLVVPTGTAVPGEKKRQRRWRHLAIEAELGFDVVGFVRQFVDALADAEIPILPMASYWFDHILVPQELHDRASAAILDVLPTAIEKARRREPGPRLGLPGDGDEWPSRR